MKIEGSGSASKSGSESGSESRSGSTSQRDGSADPDPDPHQNVMDPEHCCVTPFNFLNNSLVLYSYLRHVQSSQKLQCADLNISEGASPIVVKVTAAKCRLVALPAGCTKAQASSNLQFGHRWTKNNRYWYAIKNFVFTSMLLTTVIGRVGRGEKILNVIPFYLAT